MNRKITVSIVEDDPVFRETMVGVLAENPETQVQYVATDLQEGLSLLNRAATDVLLVDLKLPGGEGYQIISQATKSWPLCQIMVISVFSEEQKIIRAVLAGAHGYLLKSGGLDSLREEVNKLIRGERAMSASVAQVLYNFVQSQGDTLGLLPPDMAEAKLTEADTPTAESLFHLSRREMLTMQLIAKGYNDAEILKHMGIKSGTLKTYIARVYLKLGVNSRIKALIALKLIDPSKLKSAD